MGGPSPEGRGISGAEEIAINKPMSQALDSTGALPLEQVSNAFEALFLHFLNRDHNVYLTGLLLMIKQDW